MNLARTSVVFWLLAFVPSISALTLEQLRSDPKLTPQRFASYFAEFTFKYHAEVQDVDEFLATESGDCDDYATLAAQVLREKGYTTHLVTVRMPGETHVVCYVEETRCYLDYNDRIYLIRTVATDGSLTDIAQKVARSFDARWTSAAEFTFECGVKRLVSTALHDAIIPRVLVASISRPAIKIDF